MAHKSIFFLNTVVLIITTKLLFMSFMALQCFETTQVKFQTISKMVAMLPVAE